MGRHSKFSEQDMRNLVEAAAKYQGNMAEFAAAAGVGLSTVHRYKRHIRDLDAGFQGVRYNKVVPRPKGRGRPRKFDHLLEAPQVEPATPEQTGETVSDKLQRLERENAALKRVLVGQWGFEQAC